MRAAADAGEDVVTRVAAAAPKKRADVDPLTTAAAHILEIESVSLHDRGTQEVCSQPYVRPRYGIPLCQRE